LPYPISTSLYLRSCRRKAAEICPPSYDGGYGKRKVAISDRCIFVAAAVRRRRFVRRLTPAATGILVWGGLERRKLLLETILRLPCQDDCGNNQKERWWLLGVECGL